MVCVEVMVLYATGGGKGVGLMMIVEVPEVMVS